MNRRNIILAGLGAMLLPFPKSVLASEESFPISEEQVQQVPKKFRRRMVNVSLGYPPGTIVIDTATKYLYLVVNGGKAMRYGIGVGRQGFSWAGTAKIRRKAKWPTWTPPAAMVARDEFAAKWAGGMPGGPANPLGARALYLYKGNRDTLYRIHGTTVPSSIGRAVSSGCIRMLNADVADLYDRVPLGTEVVVLQSRSPSVAENRPPAKRKRKFLFE
jgi:lipoprotein-anchoring transpeptidase ErfK/SrfK